MTCVSPPELGDRILLTYIDGRADHQVLAHLERCPHCREKFEQLTRLHNRLTAQLYRFSCPSLTELGEFCLDVVSYAQARAINQHLAECPHCSRELAQLKDYLTELAPTLESGPLERFKERVRVLVARLVNGGLVDGLSRRPTPAPAYAGLRGDEEAPLIYQANDLQVVIQVQEDPSRLGRKTILGLIIGLAEGHELEAHLWRSDQCVDTVSVDELGDFVFPNLAPDNYELILSGSEVEIHIQNLKVSTH